MGSTPAAGRDRPCSSASNRMCASSRILLRKGGACPRVQVQFVLILLVCCIPSLRAGEVNPIRRVVILNEVGNSYPLINLIDQGIRSSLSNSPYQIEIYREYMETALFPDAADQQQFRDFYIRRYQSHRPDVIITVGPSPLKLILETHRELFSGIPVVFCLPNTLPGYSITDPDFIGIESDVAPGSTLAVALHLLPGTKHVVVVGGAAPYDRGQQAEVKKQLKTYENRLDISYLTDFSLPSLLEHLKKLPNQTIVLLTPVGRDTTGRTFKSSEIGPMVMSAANAPVFSLTDRYMNHGEVGGDISSGIEQGRLAGSMAARLLNGEKPKDIASVSTATTYTFDWRALKRWGLKERDLPPGSIVLNRQEGFWELNKRYVLVGFLILLVQAIAILGLLWQRVRRRKTEVELRRSEERFSKSFRQSPLAISIASTNRDRYLEVNETFEELTGWRRDEVAGRSQSEIKLWVEPNRRSAFLKQLLAQGNVRNLEIRIRRKDGQIRTTLGSAELIEVDGENCCLSVWADITERKQAEEALASVSHKLIEAQEKERTRIARELHDDINQRIALLAVELEQLQQSNSGLDGEVRRRMIDLGRRITETGMEVQAISHRLHSSKLEILGVVSACRSFCREVAERHKVTVDFAADGVPREVPQDVTLCLFRILQESLNNAIKHSGTQHFEVRLRAVSDEIQLTVCDCGVGFDAPAALSGHGLGLISMRERASLVKGTISITSKSMAGTEITLRVPIAVNRESQAISGAA
jgi:PAS domain S-box-containing protein